MKTFYTLLATAALGLGSLGAWADDASTAASSENPQRHRHDKRNTVWIIGADPQTDDVWMLKGRAIDIYAQTVKPGFQQSGVPNFIISDRANKAVFGIGGFVSFRTTYDWSNVIQNKDFVTYDIPMIQTPSNKQRFRMDASTSRLFFKTIVHTKALGNIETYVETDFRGGDNVLRLREAYVSFKGLTFGQRTTTFVDLDAAPTTIDFQGPNAYTYQRNLMVRYHLQISPNWEFAVAAEMPGVSATTPGEAAYIVPQRVPDFPVYFQYNWAQGRSHLRASGIIRTMNYYDNVNLSTITKVGWGAMLSGRIALSRAANVFGQVVYGEGIENYIQDLNGNGYDLVSNPLRSGRLQTLPAMGWLAGFQVNFSPSWQMNAAYSQVSVWNRNNYFAQAPDTYRLSQYIVGNLFYHITPAFSVGAEYLYGTRKNADHAKAHANRAQMMVQFNF
ncbi:DcaP family trimeric outer membrane transporter [uncultured Rikenella sp.]|mgnify:CR=1 FL=1|uniref:DcaP family trimeric outer membrane transporter n=1 Tax=uncultured Rikenella sp. TaxID=368003 RepID=UPI0025CDE30B|nr:DcaP family trimeric outer membrane transporter [uncultured Rikenella sp.]